MTNPGNGQPLTYRIDLSEKVALEIKELKKQAADQGKLAAFQTAFTTIIKRLRQDPAGFGELVKRLPTLQQLVHVGSVHPLTVRFSYHLELRLVYILKVTLHL
jgi:hypothetical protein